MKEQVYEQEITTAKDLREALDWFAEYGPGAPGCTYVKVDGGYVRNFRVIREKLSDGSHVTDIELTVQP